MTTVTPQQQVINRCKEVFALAETMYGVDLSKVSISFDLKGRAAGTAGAKGFPRRYAMRFNYDMLQRELKKILDEVVPHEIAHIVCFMKPALGRNHDYGWAHVCKTLGGNGKRTHDMEVIYGKGTTYEYTTDKGISVRLNDKYHSDIQKGRVLTYRNGLGRVTLGCAYNIVGVRGKTLSQPIVNAITETKTHTVPTVPPAPKNIVRGGGSKAEVARSLMKDGHSAGLSIDEIIKNIMIANGHSRQLALSYYKNNATRCGVPAIN